MLPSSVQFHSLSLAVGQLCIFSEIGQETKKKKIWTITSLVTYLQSVHYIWPELELELELIPTKILELELELNPKTFFSECLKVWLPLWLHYSGKVHLQLVLGWFFGWNSFIW